MQETPQETGEYLGTPGAFEGGNDPRAPHFRALDWIWAHSGLADVQLAPGERAVVLIDLVKAWAALCVLDADPRRRSPKAEILGDALEEILEAGAALASLYPPDSLPAYFDHGGDLRRIVSFQGGEEETRLLTVWSKLRDGAQQRAAAV